MIRALVSAPSAVLRAGLEALLRATPGVEVAGSVPGTAGLAAAIERLQPDVVVADLSGREDESPPRWLGLAPAVIVPPDAGAAEIAAGVEAAVAGVAVVQPGTLGYYPLDALPAGVEDLTAREREVLAMLAEGAGNKAAARKLGISEHTVKFHVASIMGKLQAASRTEAVTIGIRRGLILL